MRLSTPGIVLRDFKLEDNRILTILTKEYGVLTAFANRANRPRSAMAGSTELLCYSDFVLFKRQSGWVVDDADSINTFFKIRSHYENLSLASYFAQLFSELAPEQSPAEDYIQLLLGCLYYLENEERSALLLKSVAELRILTISGYMPNLVGCHHCGSYTTDKMYFSFSGELICSDCINLEVNTNYVALSDSVLAAMRHIIYSLPKKIFAFKLSEESLKELAVVSEKYLLFKIEKTLPTLEFYRTLVG